MATEFRGRITFSKPIASAWTTDFTERHDHPPVSYTHLDVYKRQFSSVARRTASTIACILSVMPIPGRYPSAAAFMQAQLISVKMLTVSYTHLDVYKRQDQYILN